jgi:hypothetical protein
MVGKPFRKKQVVAQYERPEEAINIDIPWLLGGDNYQAALAELPMEFQLFLLQFSQEKTSLGQVRALQSQKRKMRTLLLGPSISQDQKLACMELLLKLYLFPNFFVFQTSLEWIGSCIHELQQVGDNSVVEIVSKIGTEILVDVPTSRAELDSQHVLRWLPAFNALAVLDRETQWLSYAQSGQNMALIPYASVLIELFSMASEQLRGQQHPGSGSDGETQGDDLDAEHQAVPQLIQWSNICTECARNVVSVLKCRKQLSLSLMENTTGQFAISLTKLFIQSWHLLQSEFVPSKDSYTSAGSAVVLVFSLLLPSAFEMSVVNNFVRCICRNEKLSSEVVSTLEKACSSQLTITPFDLSTVPVISKCSLLRGIVHILDIELLLTVNDVDSLFFEEILLSICHHCLHGKSSDQLYALQTLEVWVVRLLDLLRRDTATTKAPVLSLQTLFSKTKVSLVSNVLCVSWAHPARQVSHLVPAIYESFVKTLMLLNQDSLAALLVSNVKGMVTV